MTRINCSRVADAWDPHSSGASVSAAAVSAAAAAGPTDWGRRASTAYHTAAPHDSDISRVLLIKASCSTVSGQLVATDAAAGCGAPPGTAAAAAAGAAAASRPASASAAAATSAFSLGPRGAGCAASRAVIGSLSAASVSCGQADARRRTMRAWGTSNSPSVIALGRPPSLGQRSCLCRQAGRHVCVCVYHAHTYTYVNGGRWACGNRSK